MSEGWVTLHRKIQNNPLWKSEPFTRGQAWVDLILLANHEDGFIYVRGNKISIKRGQVGWSQKKLSERWQWSRTKVRKFLKDLEEEQQIRQHKNALSTVITLINYDKYQPEKQQSGQQKNSRETAERQQRNTNNNEKNVKNDKKVARVHGVPIPQPLRVDGFKERYEDYWDYLGETRQLTPSIPAVQAHFRTLIELQDKGNDPLKVIDQTMAAGNKSFYALRDYEEKNDDERKVLSGGTW